jgi:GNAT superfamily N-acetyltransferase/predicted GNAT family acetyltransferase
MTAAGTVDVEQLGGRLPGELRARVGDPAGADLERIIAFQNRYARPAQQMGVEMARRFERTNPQPKRLTLLVEDGAGEVVGYGQTGDGGVFSRGDGVFRTGIRVAPEWRRKGVATVLLDALASHVKGQGGSKLVTSVRGDEPEGLEFARRHGFEEYHRRVDSYVKVDGFDPSTFDDPDAVAAKAGVTLVPYAELAREHGATPETLEAFQRALYATISEASQDIPSAEPVHNPPFEAIREMYFGEKSFDHPSSIIAMRDGKPVGSTITTLNDAGVAYTVHTGMLRGERGKGIATALKLRALRALREKGVRLYGTTTNRTPPCEGSTRVSATSPIRRRSCCVGRHRRRAKCKVQSAKCKVRGCG